MYDLVSKYTSEWCINITRIILRIYHCENIYLNMIRLKPINYPIMIVISNIRYKVILIFYTKIQALPQTFWRS